MFDDMAFPIVYSLCYVAAVCLYLSLTPQAKIISHWNNQLNANQLNLDGVMATMNELIINQDQLSTICDTIDTYQGELDADITSLTSGLEDEWARISAEEEENAGAQTSNSDLNRENTFSLVTQLETQLLKMQGRVDSLSAQYRSEFNPQTQTPGAGVDANSTIPQIIGIISHYQENMEYLQKSARGLQQQVGKLKADLY
mgnify:CR=1 FL=1